MIQLSQALVDTHCHLDLDDFAADREAVLARARAAGLNRVMCIGTDLASSRAVIKLAEQYAEVYAAVGWHPNSAGDFGDKEIKELRTLAAHPKVKALGEIGLDYHRTYTEPAWQQRTFQAQLDLAAELKLPIIVHCRDAFADTMPLLRGRGLRGVLHSFSGTVDQAREVLAENFYVGVTGPITFPKGEVMRAVAASVPLEKLLIETDAPYLTPHPYRGKRNEPAYVQYVAQQVATVRQHSLELIAAHTSANALTLFDWSE